MSSVQELETRNAVERKKLMQSIAGYLGQLNVQGNLVQEPDLDSMGAAITEPLIKLKGHIIDSIRLIRMPSSRCETGEVLRFQFRILLSKEISKEFLSRLKAQLKTIKTGKILGLFGGKIVAVKWEGQELADILNHETELLQVLLRHAQTWDGLEIEIKAASPSEINISGPWFVNPNTITALFSSGKSYEEQNCIFGYQTIEKIAGIIQEKVLTLNSEKSFTETKSEIYQEGRL